MPPSIGTGRYRIEPATSSLQSMLPPQKRGGTVECWPGPAGGIPVMPMKGCSRTDCPNWLVPTPASVSSTQRIGQSPPSATPRRRFTSLGQPPATDHPQGAGSTARKRISRTIPARAPSTAIGPHTA